MENTKGVWKMIQQSHVFWRHTIKIYRDDKGVNYLVSESKTKLVYENFRESNVVTFIRFHCNASHCTVPLPEEGKDLYTISCKFNVL